MALSKYGVAGPWRPGGLGWAFGEVAFAFFPDLLVGVYHPKHLCLGSLVVREPRGFVPRFPLLAVSVNSIFAFASLAGLPLTGYQQQFSPASTPALVAAHQLPKGGSCAPSTCTTTVLTFDETIRSEHESKSVAYHAGLPDGHDSHVCHPTPATAVGTGSLHQPSHIHTSLSPRSLSRPPLLASLARLLSERLPRRLHIGACFGAEAGQQPLPFRAASRAYSRFISFTHGTHHFKLSLALWTQILVDCHPTALQLLHFPSKVS